ncbi:hypothetical protein A2U01_0018208, partial [Trifolium medium]|nr:hypothetical protein [Trifolium medium]
LAVTTADTHVQLYEGNMTANSGAVSVAPPENKVDDFDNGRLNATLRDVSAYAILETTQKVVIVPYDDFDEVVRADLQVIKQVWADMDKGEKPSTPFITKSQKKNKCPCEMGGGLANWKVEFFANSLYMDDYFVLLYLGYFWGKVN